MTLDEAIKHAEEVADKKEREKQKWGKWLENDSDYRAVAEKVSCELCAEEHRQLAEWLKELKQLREQTRWIPVSKQLPKENEYIEDVCKYYLIQDEYGDMHVAHLSNVGWIPMDSLKAIGNEIVAWQELPQPYKGRK